MRKVFCLFIIQMMRNHFHSCAYIFGICMPRISVSSLKFWNFQLLLGSRCHEESKASLVGSCLPFQRLPWATFASRVRSHSYPLSHPLQFLLSKPLNPTSLSSPFAPARQQPSRSKAKAFLFATLLPHLLHLPLGSVQTFFFPTPLLSQPPIRGLPSTSLAAPSKLSSDSRHLLCDEVPSFSAQPSTTKVSQYHTPGNFKFVLNPWRWVGHSCQHLASSNYLSRFFYNGDPQLNHDVSRKSRVDKGGQDVPDGRHPPFDNLPLDLSGKSQGDNCSCNDDGQSVNTATWRPWQ